MSDADASGVFLFFVLSQSDYSEVEREVKTEKTSALSESMRSSSEDLVSLQNKISQKFWEIRLQFGGSYWTQNQ